MHRILRPSAFAVLAALLLVGGFALAQSVKQPVFANDDFENPIGYAELDDGPYQLEVELFGAPADGTTFVVELDGRLFLGTLSAGVWTAVEVGTGDPVGVRVELDDDPLDRGDGDDDARGDDDGRDDDDGRHDDDDDDDDDDEDDDDDDDDDDDHEEDDDDDDDDDDD